MRTCLPISKSSLITICAILFSTLILSSCSKKSESINIPPVALVTFIQASPDEPPMDFYLNSNKIAFDPINYGSSINYFRAYPGKRTVNLYQTSTMTTIFSDTVTFNPNFVYSLFLANKAVSPELVLLTDSISKPASGNANIRFINLSPDAPAVDLAVKNGAVLVSNKPFKGHSSFLPIAGETTYTFEIHQAGTNTILATLPAVKLNSGFVYTIWFHGLANPANANDGLSVDILTNAYYY